MGVLFRRARFVGLLKFIDALSALNLLLIGFFIIIIGVVAATYFTYSLFGIRVFGLFFNSNQALCNFAF